MVNDTAPKKKKTAQKRSKKNRKKQQGRVGRIVFGVLVGLAAASVAFFIYVKVQGEISIAENAVGSLVSPVQNAVSYATGWVRDWIGDLTDVDQLRSDYDQLQIENMRLSYQLSQLQEEAQENDRLRALLSAQDKYETLDPVYARVIAKSSGRWFDSFSINKGTLAGVSKGMAVINGDGLVGRVYEAGLNYAKVMAVINSDSAVACLIERTRDNGILKGQLSAASDDDSCKMYYVPSVNDIVPGDTVVSSGLDGVYPKGLTIGTVTEVSRQSDTSDQYLVVKPAVDFQRLEEVLVLQTVVETDSDEQLPSLPKATTRAQPTAVPEATPTPVPGATDAPESTGWSWPTATPDPGAIAAPMSPEGFLEDIWAES